MENYLIIGDLHGNISEIRQLMSKFPEYKFICVGDIELYNNFKEAKKNIREYRNKDQIFQLAKSLENDTFVSLPKQLFSLTGCHGVRTRYLNVLNILTTPVSIDGMESKTNHNFSLDNIEYAKVRLKKMPYESRLVISYQAPFGILPKTKSDMDEGSVKLRDILDAVKPKYWIHGHHHINYADNIVHSDGTITHVIGLGNFFKNPLSYYKLTL